MLKYRWQQWVANIKYQQDKEDGFELAEKIFKKRKLRNNFNKYLAKTKELRRVENVRKRCDWFVQTRSKQSQHDCYQSWRLYIKRQKLAKKVLVRSCQSLDKQLVNEGFNKWKQMVSYKRQKVYLDNIEELNRRQEEH